MVYGQPPNMYTYFEKYIKCMFYILLYIIYIYNLCII